MNLSAYPSGIYTITPFYSDQIVGPMSLPFTVYTPEPALTPLAREINFSVTMQVNDTQAQVLWQVNEAFKTQPIQVSCDYMGTDNEPYVQEATLKPGDVLVFEHAVNRILALSVELRLQAGAIPEQDTWIPVLIAAIPDPEQGLFADKGTAPLLQGSIRQPKGLPQIDYFESLAELNPAIPVDRKAALTYAKEADLSLTLWRHSETNPTQLVYVEGIQSLQGQRPALHLLCEETRIQGNCGRWDFGNSLNRCLFLNAMTGK